MVFETRQTRGVLAESQEGGWKPQQHMGIIPDEFRLPIKSFLKASNFDGDGQKLVIKSFGVCTPENAEFGAGEDNIYVKEGKLEANQTFRFEFLGGEFGDEIIYDTASVTFVRAFQQADINKGDNIQIQATGAGKTRRYAFTKLGKKDA